MYPPPPGPGDPWGVPAPGTDPADPWAVPGPPPPAVSVSWLGLLPAAVILTVLAFVAGVVAGRGVLDDDAGLSLSESFTAPEPSPVPEPSRLPYTQPPTNPPGGCAYELEREASGSPGPPTATGIRATGTVTVTLQLAQGPVRLELFADRAPCTVHSFLHLARRGYYDDTRCHRLTSSASLSVLQCGDPTGTGAGGPGYRFADENLAGAEYLTGTVAMANAGPGTNGSQFFLSYRDNTLPPNYTVFGRITAGLDVIRAIAAKGSDPPVDGRPKADARIRRVTIAA